MKRFYITGKIDYEDYEEYISEVNTIDEIEKSIKNYLNESNLYIDSVKIIDSQKYEVYKFRIYEDDYSVLKLRIEDMIKEIREEIQEF